MTDYKNLRKIVTGDIVVKCRYGDDIRRIPINQAPTYDELCIMMNRVYKDKIKSPNDIVLKYTDDEGDLINLSDDNDITHAISISNLLKVTVYDQASSTDHVVSSTNIEKSLAEVQTTLSRILKYFADGKQTQGASNSADDSSSTVKPQAAKTKRALTSAELASFDTAVSKNRNEVDALSVNELATLSPDLSVKSLYSRANPAQSELPQCQPQTPSSQGQPVSQPLPRQQLPVFVINNNQQANQPQQQQPTMQPQQQPQQQQQQSYPHQQLPPSSTAHNQQYLQPQQQHLPPPSHPNSRAQAPPSAQYQPSIPPVVQQRPPFSNPSNNYGPAPPPPPPAAGLLSQQTGTNNNIAGNQQPPLQQYYRPPPTNW